MPQGRTGGGPHPERPVHVHPGVTSRVADVIQRIESARVDVAGLGADDSRSRRLGQGGTEGIRPHAALFVRGYGAQARGTETQKAEGPVYGNVPLLADQNSYPGRAQETIGL